MTRSTVFTINKSQAIRLPKAVARGFVALRYMLVTNNRREFDRVDGLRVENWLVA